MSRIGRMPITSPRRRGSQDRETATWLRSKGPKGTLTQTMHPDMTIAARMAT